jgi:hypothetical protein
LKYSLLNITELFIHDCQEKTFVNVAACITFTFYNCYLVWRQEKLQNIRIMVLYLTFSSPYYFSKIDISSHFGKLAFMSWDAHIQNIKLLLCWNAPSAQACTDCIELQQSDTEIRTKILLNSGLKKTHIKMK